MLFVFLLHFVYATVVQNYLVLLHMAAGSRCLTQHVIQESGHQSEFWNFGSFRYDFFFFKEKIIQFLTWQRGFFFALRCCWASGRSEHPAMPQAHSSKGECCVFLSGMLQHSQSFWYSSWHFGFWKLWQNHWGTGPGLGPISLQGQPGALRTFLVISIATKPPPIPRKMSPSLVAFQHHERGPHLSAHFLSFLHLLRQYSV